MKIIEHYTGNPMLNNALMTIKALSGISTISELTTEKLRDMIQNVNKELPYSLMDLNLRFKSYTMFFTRNGPLNNDKKLGKEIYQTLLLKIVDGYESDGEILCDVTGLKYTKTFSHFLLDTLIELGVPRKEALNKELTLSRCWFPLLGGLGSDAQSLPMAKYTYNVHPICVPILQFLPLSALLYKKGILLIDSCNINFCERYIKSNTDNVVKRAMLYSVTQSIENIKDFEKGNYIIKALKIMQELDFSGVVDINLWSFSNSGTGANCCIDRVPCSLLRRLEFLYVKHTSELTRILNNPLQANSFITDLDDGKEWHGLYPSKDYKGSTVEFFESYMQIIGKNKELGVAKYIAYLILKYKTNNFDDILNKTDAYDIKKYNYGSQMAAILLKATISGEWFFEYQLSIQNNIETFPISISSPSIYKKVHFYYQNNVFQQQKPEIEHVKNNISLFCYRIIELISKEKDPSKIVNRIIEQPKEIVKQNFDNTIFDELLIRNAKELDITINTLFPLLYNDIGQKKIYGLCFLLRYYYSEPSSLEVKMRNDYHFPILDVQAEFKNWFIIIDTFVNQYLNYRLQGISDMKHTDMIKKIIRSIPKNDIRSQYIWFLSIWNKFKENNTSNDLDESELIFNPNGEYAFRTFMFIFRLTINKKL